MRSAGTGALYRKSDYAGALTRILVDLIDILAILAFGIAACFAAHSLGASSRAIARIICLVILLAFGYLGPWKATGYPTLGYLLFRLQLVNAQGRRPDFWQASGRALFLGIGPVNYLIDVFWLYGETPRQALRDKFSGTYLIKKNAVPVAEGKVVSKVLHVMGYRAVVQEIQKPAGSER